ncbi:MAG: hypothetical protein O2957_06795 [Verrucomicrobia bacterium]|nr:hypothetical protein [Verrucomicrobiota bacterium]
MKSLVLLAILILPLNLPAGEDHSHGPSYGQIEVPSTLPEVRAMIASKQSELTALLAAGDARGAHAATELLVACVQAIPGLLTAADGTGHERIEGMANNAAKAWVSVAHDGDHGDFAGAARQADKAAAAYRLLEARLPR